MTSITKRNLDASELGSCANLTEYAILVKRHIRKINIKDKFTMFEGINKVGYAKIYKKVEDGKYELF